jgi:hypothetical protein
MSSLSQSGSASPASQWQDSQAGPTRSRTDAKPCQHQGQFPHAPFHDNRSSLSCCLNLRPAEAGRLNQTNRTGAKTSLARMRVRIQGRNIQRGKIRNTTRRLAKMTRDGASDDMQAHLAVTFARMRQSHTPPLPCPPRPADNPHSREASSCVAKGKLFDVTQSRLLITSRLVILSRGEGSGPR